MKKISHIKKNTGMKYFLSKLQEIPNFNGYSCKLCIGYSKQNITFINWNLLTHQIALFLEITRGQLLISLLTAMKMKNLKEIAFNIHMIFRKILRLQEKLDSKPIHMYKKVLKFYIVISISAPFDLNEEIKSKIFIEKNLFYC